MFNSKERMDFIIEYISAYKEKIEMANKQGLFDSAKMFELFAIEICKLFYGQKFKNLNGYENDVFTVNFDLEYKTNGFLRIKNVENNYFDVGDFGILLDEVFEKLNKDLLKKYDNGVYILSMCKYIVDNVPNLYSINYESSGIIDIYLKQEIIDDYNKIKKGQDKNEK